MATLKSTITVMPCEPPCLFTSMGMFIIDENRYPPTSSKKSEYNIIGGGLTYAVVGARMITGFANGTSVAGIVDKGSDFPEEIERELQRWNTGLVFRDDPSRLTTRGVNDYLENGIRDFYYETPKKRIEVMDILAYDRLLQSKSLHLICSIERCEEIIDTILANRSDLPLIIWEPVPYDCVPENFEALVKVLHKVDVFTPNLIEAQNFISVTSTEIETSEIRGFIEKHFFSYMTKENAGTLIRCGERGCYIKTKDLDLHLPAYHDDQAKVIDPTGGGNLFCGGFMMGYLLSNKNWKIGGICGNIVSGCIIEKLGPPIVEYKNGNEYELWNGESISDRLKEYARKYPILKNDIASIDWISN